MKNNIKKIIFFIVIIFLIFIFNFKFIYKKNKKIDLNISSAISLREVLDNIKFIYEKKYKNINIIFNFSSSGSLQRQIEQGADVDIFISASEKEINMLNEKNIILENSKTILAKNKIVLITNINNTNFNDWRDLCLSKIHKIALGDPESVPVGFYAREMLKNMNIYDKISNKLVLAKNAKEILFWIESNNVDLGIVYLTDAKMFKKIKIVKEGSENINKKISYSAVIIKNSKKIKESKIFLNFIKNDNEIKKIFKKFGFIKNN